MTEELFLLSYNAANYDRPNASIDCVIYSILDDALHVLLIERTAHPFKGHWSLVGGYVDIANDTDLEATAKRKLLEKTGVKTPYLEQFRTIGNKDRDPRGWSLTTVYFALIPPHQGGRWERVTQGEVKTKLAFDHAKILRDCTLRLQSKVLYTSLPLYLMPKEFTLHELQRAYETVLEKSLDSKSFRRRILPTGLIEETGRSDTSSKRPAKIYRRTRQAQPHFFSRSLESAAI